MTVVLYEPLVLPATDSTTNAAARGTTANAGNNRKLMGVEAQEIKGTTNSESSTGDSQPATFALASSASADASHVRKVLLQQYSRQDATAEKRIVETERAIQDTFQR
jgi:hypothetical protein